MCDMQNVVNRGRIGQGRSDRTVCEDAELTETSPVYHGNGSVHQQNV